MQDSRTNLGDHRQRTPGSPSAATSLDGTLANDPGTRETMHNALAGSEATTIQPPTKSHPLVRRILREWRIHTGDHAVRDADRRTLVACSGGADSTALLLALAAATPEPVVAHVIHDLRPAAEAQADAAAVARLAAALGLDFDQTAIHVRPTSGNAEAVARRLRYHALEQMATKRGLRWIATGHHADDQLETVLMRLIRGAGPRGMAGIASTKPLGACALVRPLLVISRADCERLCIEANTAWRTDQTNADLTRTRAALRHNVLPQLHKIRPTAATAAAQTALSMRSASDALHAIALDLWNEHADTVDADAGRPASEVRLPRSVLASQHAAVLEAFFHIAQEMLANSRGADARNRRAVNALAAVIRDRRTESRELRLGTLQFSVVGARVIIRPTPCGTLNEGSSGSTTRRRS